MRFLSKTLHLSLLVSILTLPTSLILLDLVSFEWRFQVLIFIFLISVLISLLSGYSLKDLGVSGAQIKKSLLLNIIFSLAISFVLFSLYLMKIIRAPTVPNWSLFFPFYIIISCPAQEFIYRSFLFAVFRQYNNNNSNLYVAVSALSYSFMHIIYLDAITLIVSLGAGVIWAAIYQKHPNFWGVALSHAILGSVSIIIGLI